MIDIEQARLSVLSDGGRSADLKVEEVNSDSRFEEVNFRNVWGDLPYFYLQTEL